MGFFKLYIYFIAYNLKTVLKNVILHGFMGFWWGFFFFVLFFWGGGEYFNKNMNENKIGIIGTTLLSNSFEILAL